MATEIHRVGSEGPPTYEGRPVDEKKEGFIQTDESSDLERRSDSDRDSLGVDRAEATELIPGEAFKWNVEGDQSPCKSQHKVRCHSRNKDETNRTTSPRGSGLCSEYR